MIMIIDRAFGNYKSGYTYSGLLSIKKNFILKKK